MEIVVILALVAASAGALLVSRKQIYFKGPLIRLLGLLENTGITGAEVLPTGHLVVRRGTLYRVSRFIVVEDVKLPSQRLSDAELGRLSRSMASIVYSSDLRSTVIVYREPLNPSKYLKKIERKILNLRLALENNPEDKGLERRLRLLEETHTRILQGEKPQRAVMMVGLVAEASSLDDAAKRVDAEARALLSSLSSLGLVARLSRPRDLYQLLNVVLGGRGGGSELFDTDLSVAGVSLIPRPPSLEGVYVGYELDTSAPYFYDYRRYLPKHLVVLGPTGKGKTTFLATLTARILALERLEALVIDFKGDLAPGLAGLLEVVDGSALCFADLARRPENYPPGAWSYLVIESLKTSLDLDPREEHMLYTSLTASYAGGELDVPRLLDMLGGEPEGAKLASKISHVLVDNCRGAGDVVGAAYDLGSVAGDVKNLYASLILARLVARMEVRGVNQGLKTLVVVDEAWRLLRNSGAVLRRLFKEARSYGVGVVLATQNPEDLPPEIIDNAGTVVAFGSPADEYVSKIARLVSLREEEHDRVRWLGVGEAVLRVHDDPRPVWIRIDRAGLSGQ